MPNQRKVISEVKSTLIGKAPKYIMHRGVPSVYPENSIIGFEASKIGWGCETDIHETLDNELVCIHDEKIDRTFNGSGNICEMTLPQLNNITMKSSSNTPVQKIPTFELFLNACFVAGTVPVIELKKLRTDLAYHNLLSTLERKQLLDSVVIIDFNIEALKKIRSMNSDIRLQYLANDLTMTHVEAAKSVGSCDLSINHTALNSSKVNLARNNGLEVGAWTVNSISRRNELLGMGVSFITTERDFQRNQATVPLLNGWKYNTDSSSPKPLIISEKAPLSFRLEGVLTPCGNTANNTVIAVLPVWARPCITLWKTGVCRVQTSEGSLVVGSIDIYPNGEIKARLNIEKIKGNSWFGVDIEYSVSPNLAADA